MMDKNDIEQQIYKLIHPRVDKSRDLASTIVNYCKVSNLLILLDNYVDVGYCIHTVDHKSLHIIAERREPVCISNSIIMLSKLFSTSGVQMYVHRLDNKSLEDILDRYMCYIMFDGEKFTYSYERLSKRKESLHKELISVVNNSERIKWCKICNDDMFGYLYGTHADTRTNIPITSSDINCRIQKTKELITKEFEITEINGLDVVVKNRNAVVIRIIDSDFTLYDVKSLAERVNYSLRDERFDTVTVIMFGISGCFNKSNKEIKQELTHRLWSLKNNIRMHSKYPPMFSLRVYKLFIK